MRGLSFDNIQKKLDRKNAELVNVRSERKKLADREKQLSADIESLQNQKVELIFLQVKKQIKSENLDISSGSIVPLLEVLRNNSQLVSSESLAEEDTTLKIAEFGSDSKSGSEENFSVKEVDESR